ncbi:MAG: PfkB family carbohydrate kinase [Phycisphaerales bacterium]
MRGILSREQMMHVRSMLKEAGLKLVQCHGCFDIVHPGHIRHLRQAKSLGDVLLVSITGDDTMKKGTGRPLIPQELRAENLAALDFVDFVYIEPGPTAQDLLEWVRPDVYVKGKEYETNNDPRFGAERATVERHGGRVVFSSGDVVFSSSALIAAMEQSVDPFHARLAQLTRAPELSATNLGTILSDIRGKRLVVVGETILDTYTMCDRPDVAGESPVMTLRPLEQRRYDGGAAIIARHAAALGAIPTLVTALPDNDEGRALAARLHAEGIEVRSLRVEARIPEKQRYLVGTQKMVKIDLVEQLVLDASQQRDLMSLAVDAAGPSCDAAVVADFGLGLFSASFLTDLCAALRPLAGTLCGDVSGRRSNLLSMRQMDLVCPSENELRDATRKLSEGLPLAAWTLLDATASRNAIVTMGGDGLIAFDRLSVGDASPTVEDGSFSRRLRGEHVPALSPMAIDALGCGDALLTTAALALSTGCELLPAAFLGACAAAIQVQRLGNLPVSASEVRKMVARVHGAHLTFSTPEVLESRGSRRAVG